MSDGMEKFLQLMQTGNYHIDDLESIGIALDQLTNQELGEVWEHQMGLMMKLVRASDDPAYWIINTNLMWIPAGVFAQRGELTKKIKEINKKFAPVSGKTSKPSAQEIKQWRELADSPKKLTPSEIKKTTRTRYHRNTIARYLKEKK